MRAKKLDYARFEGKKFNYVTIVDFSHKIGKKSYMNAVCECGHQFKLRMDAIGITKTCGCGINGKQRTKLKDYSSLLGTKAHYLTLLKLVGSKNGANYSLVECDCGEKLEIPCGLFGKMKTCGCGIGSGHRNKEKDWNSLIGEKRNMLTCIENLGLINKRRKIRCKCDCGEEVIIRGEDFGVNIGCGCYHNPDRTVPYSWLNRKGKDVPAYIDGRSKEKLYAVWWAIKHRCYSPSTDGYKWYGARGIKMCDEWLDYGVFRQWAYSNGYEKGLTIERRDNDGHYEPNNCYWTTHIVQGQNKRNSRLIEYKGEFKTLRQWCELLGLEYNKLKYKMYRIYRPTDNFKLEKICVYL